MTTAAPPRTSYRVKVHQIECCSCSVACMCQFGGRPAPGFCEFAIGWEVIEGHFGPVALKGVRFVGAIKYPGAIHEGNGSAALFVDQSVSAEQRNAIASILTGQHGGMPWEALAATITRFEGPIPSRIDMKADGTRSSFSVGDAVVVQHTPIKDLVSGDEKEIHIVYPRGGFFWNDGNICTTATMQVNHGDLKYAHPGGYAAHAITLWTNEG